MKREDLMKFAPMSPKTYNSLMAAARSVEEEDQIVKKKVSAAFVLSIIIILIAVGAIAAALLSGKDFVEQELVPRVNESVSDHWMLEEVEEILRIASENNISLPDDVIQRLRNAEGAYEEEVLRAFLKADWGFYPAMWSIEDQAWYDELLIKCGLSDTQTRFVPTGEEISISKALEIAVMYVEEHYDDSVDITDETLYRRFVEYRQFAYQNGSMAPLRWYIEYEALDPTLNSHTMTISTEGTVEEAVCSLGVKGMVSAPNVDSVFDYYTETYGLHYEWTQNVWEELQKDLEYAVSEHGHSGDASIAILRQRYGTPDVQSIPAAKAIQAAQNAIVQEMGISETELEANYSSKALYLVDAAGPTWKINFVSTIPNGPYAFTLHYAEVDAYTGDVLNTGHYQPGTNKWYEAYVLMRTLHDDPNAPSNG